ncbi:MAG: tRNA (adenosine(37)-N6)-threonylcarbamoyltransferase complex transferase subunit TsaD [Deltaproteobacteria bacterium]|nr:tRNA (adenosine(37)-N6)-threonylcarbamoyltransferase complex transferase subunit TsaD [Deltaproteobacteria bacterium]
MRVLGIETSCDETAAGVVGPEGILSDATFTQLEHVRFGGVVPEIAGRVHAERITATVDEALARAGCERPDAVAATAGPGLIGALLVGFSWGRASAFAWGVPFVPVNHLEAHLLTPLLADASLDFPFLALVVSGGHTALYRAEAVGRYATLARTVDDAAGEACDKVARLLGLGYPGGPLLDRLATRGNPSGIRLPRPRSRGLDLSFSGLKTAVRTLVETEPGLLPEDVAAAFLDAVVDVLVDRVQRAVAATGIRRLAVSGGVAANSRLRRRLADLPFPVTLPPLTLCTDNGAMVAHAGRARLLAGHGEPPDARARPVWAPGEP